MRGGVGAFVEEEVEDAEVGGEGEFRVEDLVINREKGGVNGFFGAEGFTEIVFRSSHIVFGVQDFLFDFQDFKDGF